MCSQLPASIFGVCAHEASPLKKRCGKPYHDDLAKQFKLRLTPQKFTNRREHVRAGPAAPSGTRHRDTRPAGPRSRVA